MGRPFGQRIRQIIEILEKIGPAPYNKVWTHMQDVDRSNVGKFCQRAVKAGFLTCDDSFPRVYWIVGKPTPPAKRVAPTVPRSKPKGPASVWELAGHDLATLE